MRKLSLLITSVGFVLGLCGTAQAQLYSSGNNIIVGNNVGIGVAAPAHKLDVAGDLNLSSGSALRINGAKVLDVPGTSNVHLGAGTGTSSSDTGPDYQAPPVVTTPCWDSSQGRWEQRPATTCSSARGQDTPTPQVSATRPSERMREPT